MTKRRISLVLSDIDGTLVTDDKRLTQASIDAVRRLKRAGIRFAIASSRPPRGMAMFVKPLQIETPIAGFNGGVFTRPDLSIIKQQIIDPRIAKQSLEHLSRAGLSVWLFSGNDWLVKDPNGPHVAHETHTVDFAPTVVRSFDDRLAAANKIVGVSDDHALIERCEAEAKTLFGSGASISRSQPYYLDITSIRANKGVVADFLASHLNVPKEEIATIGDSQNDVFMFKRSGFSIAMGNASRDVKAEANVTTDTNQEDGFARAIDQFILSA
ncbi:MAG TPA: Cof-type HAD-IIB family hydrolase [Micropepsaceae bacterium]|nr:Cof-type HAD-IIB family hydrolase [Micropepsaceae bacterium]